MKQDRDQYLSHYGIPGMKWGVRRTPEQLGHRTAPSAADKVITKIKSVAGDYVSARNRKKAAKLGLLPNMILKTKVS